MKTVEEAIEAAAQVCESRAQTLPPSAAVEAMKCAMAIRALRWRIQTAEEGSLNKETLT